MILAEYLLNNTLLKNIVNKNDITIANTHDNYNIMMIAADFLQTEKSLFIVLPSLFLAQKYYDELINILPEDEVLFYPADELITAEMLIASGDFKFERINTITTLIKDDSKKIIITHLNGAIKYQFPKEKWQESILNIKVNEHYEIDDLVKKLISLGYEMVYTTVKSGQFSRRGSILDIFPMNYQEPVRLDFFDDELEKIKVFDIDTQISKGMVNKIEIIPVTEMIYSDKDLNHAIKEFEKFIHDNELSETEKVKFDKDLFNLNERNNVDMLTRYISFFSKKKSLIFDFVSDYKTYIIDQNKMNNGFDGIIRDLEQYCSGIGGYNLLKLNYFLPIEKLYKLKDIKFIEGLGSTKKNVINVFARETIEYHADQKMIISDLKKFISEKIMIIFIKNPTRLDNFKETCLDNSIFYGLINSPRDISKGKINIISTEYSPAFELMEEKILVLNEKSIFETSHEQRRIKYKSIYSNSTKISKYDELVIGDYVVHYDYGIGQYLGLTTMNHSEVKRDYIYILYANDDALYLPIEQINLIQKFNASDTISPKLTVLGGGQWARAKQRVKKRIREISEKLIKLYAERQMAVGFSFSPDSTEQAYFEADFPYELTDDQEQAIKDVKLDMESSRPMDRLICGDVGYGKTEVALRAAFKAILSGKQVALLAPTTILSRQHYYTFKNRMDKFGIEVALLNRFVPLSRQNEMIKKIASGQCDIVIGTHRILSPEIAFKDLGLLIIDEEQRFGVTHKERIKELKVNIDTITLTATPIPRTLQMSLTGIKDLSMIETPPKNRYPVQTYVLERNDTLVKEAIEREIVRGGQVFYMYNFTDDIDLVASKIARLVPEARVCIGHGKLSKDELERVLSKFIDKEYDVFVCTTIIETGVDMPDANTLIVHDADRLGLSQMYQLRGRVGRSNKIAYAYFMYEPKKILTEQAEKRLQAIIELSDLGSGFKIAMRDLAIRGSGDLLGEDQSGFLESVGIEMYMKILEDEIKERQGIESEPIVEQPDISLSNVYASRHIDNNYINNEDVKIEIHKKVDILQSVDEMEKLKHELIDRFGVFDENLEFYMHEKLFKNLCKKFDVEKIDHNRNNFVVLFMSKNMSNKMDGNKMFSLANTLCKDIRLNYFNKQIQIQIDRKNYQNNNWMIPLVNYLNQLKK